jgi:hypothetical protein
MSVEETVATYVAGWNEPDDDARRKLFASCWADGGVYLDPMTVLAGLDELTAGCRRFAERSPGAVIELVGSVATHHGHASFSWCVRGADGTVLRNGIDHVELADDGRIRRVVGFFGTPPWG